MKYGQMRGLATELQHGYDMIKVRHIDLLPRFHSREVRDAKRIVDNAIFDIKELLKTMQQQVTLCENRG